MNAVFDLKDGYTYVGLWHMAWPGLDVLAMGYREGGSDPWTLKIRFRYIRDTKVWGSKDEREVLELRAGKALTRAQFAAQAKVWMQNLIDEVTMKLGITRTFYEFVDTETAADVVTHFERSDHASSKQVIPMGRGGEA